MYLKRGVFYCKLSLPGQKPVYQSLEKDKRLAKAIEAKLRAEIHEGKFFDKKKGEYLKVIDLLNLYQERYAKVHKNPETCQTDASYMRRLNPFLGDIFLKELSPLEIEGYMTQRRKDGVSDITIHHELNLLRHAFSLAFKKWDLIDRNPFDKVELPKGDRKRVRYLRPEEEDQLFAVLKNREWLRSVVVFARETGLRLSNICNLTWKQADLFKKCIEIEKTKNGKPVWIPMSDKAYAELVKWNKTRDLRTDRVFVVDGKPVNKHRVGLAFRRVCKRAGLESFRFHDLRHDFCSRLVQAGQPLHFRAKRSTPGYPSGKPATLNEKGLTLSS